MLEEAKKHPSFECGGHFLENQMPALADLFKNPSLKYVDGLFFFEIVIRLAAYWSVPHHLNAAMFWQTLS
jgi:hypothetical protein